MKKLLYLLPVLLLTLVLSLINLQLNAQDLIELKTNKPTDWTTYFSNEKVTIEYRFMECDPEIGFDQEAVVFKYTNHTEKKLTLNWHMHLYYAGVCRTCNSTDEYTYELTIGHVEPSIGDCSNEGNYTLKLFSKFIDPAYTKGAQLTAFQFANLEFTEH